MHKGSQAFALLGKRNLLIHFTVYSLRFKSVLGLVNDFTVYSLRFKGLLWLVNDWNETTNHVIPKLPNHVTN